jgi:pimeloyl-ACP methyl ester carboxylesterase
MKVLLLHAWPLDERMWESHAAVLGQAGYEAIAPRLYGRGSSIDDWAAQILRDFDGQFAAVGASMGGYCALALVRRAPERVVKLVLAGSRATADPFDRRAARDVQIAQLRGQGVPYELETDVRAEELAVAQEAIRDRMDLTAVVASFGGPLLVCVGDADDMISVDESRELAETALEGSLAVFPGAGHFLTVEQPERFDEVLLEFLA